MCESWGLASRRLVWEEKRNVGFSSKSYFTGKVRSSMMKNNPSNERQNLCIVLQSYFLICHYKVVGVRPWWQQSQATYKTDTASISSLIKCFMVAHSHTKCIFTLTHFKHFWKSHNCFGDLSFKLMKIWGEKGKGNLGGEEPGFPRKHWIIALIAAKIHFNSTSFFFY